MHYFSGTAQEAIDEWNRVKDDLLAGRAPGPKGGGLTVRELCNKFLQAKRTAVATQLLKPRTFVEYSRTTGMLTKEFGLNRLASDIRPEDFTTLYGKLATKHGLATLGREVTMVRTVFKFARESGLLERDVSFGPQFKVPSKKAKRRLRNEKKKVHGARMFSAEEIRAMVATAGPQLRAMVLLGINGGLGNTDCANLHRSHIDFDAGWLDFPRPKTEIDRRIPLWPETVAALRTVFAKRREPADRRHAGLVFLTRLGQPWVRYELEEKKSADDKLAVSGRSDDAIAKATAKLLKDLNIYRPGVTFYALRHTFETVAGGSCDQVAVSAMMGHVDNTMADVYREHIDDKRLRAVASHVWHWFSTPAEH